MADHPDTIRATLKSETVITDFRRYRQGKRTCFDDTEVLAAAGSVVTKEKLGRCVIRFEDEAGFLYS